MYKQGLWRPPWYLQSEMSQGRVFNRQCPFSRSCDCIWESLCAREELRAGLSPAGNALEGLWERPRPGLAAGTARATSSALCPGLAVSLCVPSSETAARAQRQKGIK